MRALLIALCFAAFATPAAADRFALTYEGFGLGLVPLGQISVDAEVYDSAYRAQATLQSGGLMNWFERTQLEATSNGLIVDGGVRWQRYQLDHHYSRKHRVTRMHVGADGAIVRRIAPNYRIWGDPPANDDQQRHSRDPLSTLVAMAVDVSHSQRCSGAYPTFDGRFFYLMELSGGRTSRYRGGGYDGPVLRCRLGYIAVAGFENSDRGRRRMPQGEVWFALDPGASFAPPVRISTPLSAGGAVIRLRSWRRAEVGVAEPIAETP